MLACLYAPYLYFLVSYSLHPHCSCVIFTCCMHALVHYTHEDPLKQKSTYYWLKSLHLKLMDEDVGCEMD